MKSSLVRLSLSLFVPFFMFATQTFALEVQDVIVTPNERKHSDWVDLILSAKSEVRLAMFNMSQREVVEALKQAAQNKVSVKLLFDLNNSQKINQANIIAELKAAGVEVQTSSPGFTIMHEKSMAIDGKKVLISTINLSRHSDTTRGYGVIVTDQGVVDEFLKVFEVDWKNGANGTAETPALSQPDLVWSPNIGAPKLLDLIQSAKKSLVVEVENLSYEPIIDALIEAHSKRNVDVRIITPLCDFNDDPFFNIPALRKLMAGGVKAHVMGIPNTADQPYIHAKMITADGAKTYIGSLNFSYNSLQSAREVGVLIDDQKAIGTIVSEFEKDWTKAIDVPADTRTVTCPKL